MPLEFSVAAYRYGHSQVRGLYKFNDDKVGPLFMFGASDMNKPTTYVLWKHLFNTSTTVTPVMCRKRLICACHQSCSICRFSRRPNQYDHWLRGI